MLALVVAPSALAFPTQLPSRADEILYDIERLADDPSGAPTLPPIGPRDIPPLDEPALPPVPGPPPTRACERAGQLPVNGEALRRLPLALGHDLARVVDDAAKLGDECRALLP